jgi:hypothetical protein
MPTRLLDPSPEATIARQRDHDAHGAKKKPPWAIEHER